MEHFVDAFLPDNVEREAAYASQGPEALHAALKSRGVRDLPMVSIPEAILQREYDLLLKQRVKYQKLVSKGKLLGPKTQSKFDAITESARTLNKWKIMQDEDSLNSMASVTLRNTEEPYVHRVNLMDQEGLDPNDANRPKCSCLNYNLVGLPCPAAVAFMLSVGKDPYLFVRPHLLVANHTNAIDVMLENFSSPEQAMAGFSATTSGTSLHLVGY